VGETRSIRSHRGGKAFPTVTLSADKTDITFSGGNIADKASFWSQIPLSKPFDGGTGSYQGNATPAAKRAPGKREAAAGYPQAGNDSGTALVGFDPISGTFGFTLGSVTFVQYADGTVLRANNATETIIGSGMNLPSTQLIGPSSEIPGAYELADTAPYSIETSSVFLSATLDDIQVIHDCGMSGFDTLLQGVLRWQESDATLVSQFLDELYNTVDGDFETTVLFYSNLWSATNGLTQGGSSSGLVLVTNTTAGASLVPCS
jgi:hypothetical protein